jgi:hypothetical protein
MATGNLITHSLTYTKEDAVKYSLTPMFVDADIRQICEVMTDVKTAVKLDYVSSLRKITKQYAKGSANSSTGVTITQRELRVGGVKAQVHQDGRVFLNWVKQEALKSGYQIHDISGTLFEQIVMAVWNRALARDLQAQILFANPKKEVITAGAPTGVLDEDYAIAGYLGFWELFQADIASSVFPSAQVVDLNTSTYQNQVAVKGKKTATITGTSGTANITINGVAYLATFATNLNTTAANFVAAHAATIAARFGRCSVTNSGATVIVEAGIPGLDVTVSAPVNATGDLAGSVAPTTAAVLNTSLKTDAAKLAMKAAYDKMPAVMRSIKSSLAYIVTQEFADNYMETLETATGIPAAYQKVIDGQEFFTYRGIPLVVRPQMDEDIAGDFGGLQPHRFMLTDPKNLVFGTDGSGDTEMFEMWYEQNEQENRMRNEYMGGTQYRHTDFTVIAH